MMRVTTWLFVSLLMAFPIAHYWGLGVMALHFGNMMFVWMIFAKPIIQLPILVVENVCKSCGLYRDEQCYSDPDMYSTVDPDCG